MGTEKVRREIRKDWGYPDMGVDGSCDRSACGGGLQRGADRAGEGPGNNRQTAI